MRPKSQKANASAASAIATTARRPAQAYLRSGRSTWRQTGSSTAGFSYLTASAATMSRSTSGVWPMCHSSERSTESARDHSPARMAQRASLSRASGKSNSLKESAVGFAHALRQAKRASSPTAAESVPHGTEPSSVTSSAGRGISLRSSPIPSTTTSAPRFACTGISFERTIRSEPSVPR